MTAVRTQRNMSAGNQAMRWQETQRGETAAQNAAGGDPSSQHTTAVPVSSDRQTQ